MNYHITKVYSTNTKKDGTPIVNKFGKPMWRVGLKVQEHGDVWVNGFLSFDPKDWEGKEKEIIITETFDSVVHKNILKFEVPRKDAQQLDALKRLETKIDEILALLKPSAPKVEAPADVPSPFDDF